MDSFKEVSTAKGSSKLDSDVGISPNCRKSIRKQEDGKEENVFTSMSHESNSSLLLMNGLPVNAHILSNNDRGNQSTHNTTSQNNHSTQLSYKNPCEMPNTTSDSNDVATSSSIRCDENNRETITESNYEKHTRQRHKVFIDPVGYSYSLNAPSTSGATSMTRVSNILPDSNGPKESRKRPSTLKLNRSNKEDEISSDTDNDDYSLGSEDGCIYTYKGGEHLADLPSSFFSLDMGLPLDMHLPAPLNYQVQQQVAQNAREGSRASSPDMDFLEMDFDPGPSCEVDTGDESSPDIDMEILILPEENEPVIRGTSPEYVPVIRGTSPEYVPVTVQPQLAPTPCNQIVEAKEVPEYSAPSTSKCENVVQNNCHKVLKECRMCGPYITHVNARGEQVLVRRTMSQQSHNIPVPTHVSSGDLISPQEISNYYEDNAKEAHAYQINQGEKPVFDSVNLSSTLFHMTMAKRLMVENSKVGPGNQESSGQENAEEGTCNVTCVEPPRCMVWSEREACDRQVTQIGTSACGATAVVNVFIALGIPVNTEKISSAIGTRQRANNAPLPRYILSRAVAGCTAADLVTGINIASDGLVTARFFPTYPERVMSLSHWLADWISLGAVPILTLNLQMGCDGEIPDAWHHQMVWGVSARGVYLSNPAECVAEVALWPRLAAPSTLLLRTRDVLARYTPATDLMPLAAVPDPRFQTYNVLGQVVNAIREWRSTGSMACVSRAHLSVPAAYRAGVTLAALTGSEAHRRLVHAPHLPLLDHPADGACCYKKDSKK